MPVAGRPVALPAAEQGAPLQPFSDNTIELLERAERAIDQSIELPELTRNLLAEARQLQLRGGATRRTASHGNECKGWPPTGSPNRVSLTRIPTSVSSSCTQGRSRVRNSASTDLGRAVSSDRPLYVNGTGDRIV